MPDTTPSIDNYYVLSFVQIENLITNGIKLDGDSLTIINIFYENYPLPLANEDVVANKQSRIKDQKTIRLIVPRFATFFGISQCPDNNSHFQDAFVVKNKKDDAGQQQNKKNRAEENFSDFHIGETVYKLRADMGFKNAISHLRIIFNKHYANFNLEQFYFVIQFKKQECLEKVHKQLEGLLFVNTYDKSDGTITITGSNKTQNQSRTKHVNKYEGVIKFPFSRNRIIFGAPGTGKSFLASGNANYLLFALCDKLTIADDEKNNWIIRSINNINDDNLSKELLLDKSWCMERVTFHPEYTYFDFVGSYKPVMREVPVADGKDGNQGKGEDEQGEQATERKIEYDFVPGPFARILVKALNDKEHPYLLLIEEINRARVAAVFGDIFQLLDRKENGESEYEIMPSLELARYLQNNPKLKNEEIKPIHIPNNLYIWATMNSADQGVYPLDTAFKRRWSMEYIPYGSSDDEPIKDEWNQIRTGINELLLEKGHVNEDKLMGYYFLKKEERTGDKLKYALQNKVLMYLFDDAAKHCRKEIFKIEGKDVITFSALQNKMRAAMEHSIDPNSNLGVFSEALQHPAAGNNG